MILVNGTPLNVTIFPDRTSQVWKLNPNILNEESVNVTWQFDHEGELMHLAQLKGLLDTEAVFADLLITYLPYGRQDKDCSNETTFGLHTFAQILNSLEFNQIHIIDPHSHVATEIIKNSSAIYPIDLVKKVVAKTRTRLACYPDKGAVSKYTDIYKMPHVYGEKVRNQLTGHIESYELFGNVLGQRVLIIDDICDGGMTFKLLAADLLKAGATEVNLFVTHGIFSKGVKTLFDSGIKHIYTAKGEVFHDSRGNLNQMSIQPF